MIYRSHDLGSGENVLSQTFPKLVEFSLLLKWIPLEYDKFNEFLTLNPQLRKLEIQIEADDRYISAIVENIPNLEDLQ